MYAALPGRTYPELIVRMARGEEIEPHVGEFRAGLTFTRYYWQLELDPELQPTGRDIVEPPGPSGTALRAWSIWPTYAGLFDQAPRRGGCPVRLGRSGGAGAVPSPRPSTRRRTRRSCGSGAPG